MIIKTEPSEPTATVVEPISITTNEISYFLKHPIFFGILLTLFFPILLQVDNFMQLGNILFDNEINSVMVYLIIFSVRFSLSFGLIGLIYWKLSKDQTVKSLLQQSIKPKLKFVLYGLVSGSIFLVIATIMGLMLGVLPTTISFLFENPDIYDEPDITGWMLFIIAIIPAVFEELVFRSFIFNALKKKFHRKWTIILSSLFFALYHLPMLITQSIDHLIGGIILSFFSGLAWGRLTYNTSSVIPSMVSHYILDTIGILFLYANIPDLVVSTQYMISITVLYPIIHNLIFYTIKKMKITQNQT